MILSNGLSIESYLIIIWLMKKHNEINDLMFIMYLFKSNTVMIWSYFHCNPWIWNNLFIYTFTYWIALLTKPVLELKSHPFQALLLPTFTYGTKFGDGTSKTLIGKVFEKGVKMHIMSHVKVHSLATYHMLLAKFEELFKELHALKLTMGFQQHFTHVSP